MDASRGCVYKKVCWRWNGDSAVSKCIQDCIHYTNDKSLTSNNSAMPKLLCLLEELVSDIEFDSTIQSAYYKQKLAELRSATSA